jgi:uncharacterized protein (TIGR02246 family)
MDIRIRSLLLPLALLVGACQSADDDASLDGADATAADARTAGIDALRASYVEHYNMGHADMVADMYAEDGVALMADGSVLLGREAIAAWLAEQMAGASPEVALEQIDQMAFGDSVVTIGRWSVTVTAEEGAAPVTSGGHYMAAHTPSADGWEVAGVITNYDVQQSAEALQGAWPSEPAEEESILGAFLEAYEAAWNAGDAEGLAAMYAEDAWYAGADLPAVEGRDAIQQVLEPRVRGEIDIHGVGSMDLGDGWVLDGGWFEISGAEDGDYVGSYWTLSHADDDGERLIHWLVSNGRPKSLVPSSRSAGR